MILKIAPSFDYEVKACGHNENRFSNFAVLVPPLKPRRANGARAPEQIRSPTCPARSHERSMLPSRLPSLFTT